MKMKLPALAVVFAATGLSTFMSAAFAFGIATRAADVSRTGAVYISLRASSRPAR
jgi:hypothetical protein